MNHFTFFNAISDFDRIFGKIGHDFLNAGGSFLNLILKVITILGNGGGVFIAIGILMLLFKSTRKAGMMSLISLLIGALITNIILKNAVARPRPFWDETSTFYTWWVEAGSLAQGGYSFPSGHATAAMAFAFPIFMQFEKKMSWLMLLMAIIMGFTRIYFQVHFASDVLIGLIVGVVTGIAAIYSVGGLLTINAVKKAFDLPSILALFTRQVN